jgi:hypothetical protein
MTEIIGTIFVVLLFYRTLVDLNGKETFYRSDRPLP